MNGCEIGVNVNLLDNEKSLTQKLNGFELGRCAPSRVVAKWLEFILSKPGDHPMKPKVLLLGFTGMAANLIGKTVFLMTYIYLSKQFFL